MLVPTGEEEAGTGQLLEMVLVVGPLTAAAAAVHSFGLLSFLNIPSCFLHPVPIHHTAAKILCTAAADIEIVRATLPSALNVINASSVGKLVQLVTASRLTLYHGGRIDPMKDECHYQVKH